MDSESEVVADSESSSEYRGSPQALARRWQAEIRAAKEHVRQFVTQGQNAVKRFLAEQERDATAKKSKLNLFHSDVNTLRSMLLGRLPQTDAERRHHDADDDVARVAADVLSRVLDAEIDSTDDGYVATLKYAIEDWTLPGIGVARVRYEIGEEEVTPGAPAKMASRSNPDTGETEEYEAAPEVPETTSRPEEEAEAVYCHWKDFLWSPARIWHEVTWVAFGYPMRQGPFVKQFGQQAWSIAPKRSATPRDANQSAEGDDLKRVWSEVYVYEIWCKDTREVHWYVDGMDRLLQSKPDPLGLKGFFPCPRPLFANTTTTKLLPKPDLEIARDLYDEVDEITSRITLLQRAAKVAGVYDATQTEVARLVDESAENDLIPVDSWLALVEKGGLEAIVQFMPLEPIVKAIEVLTLQRENKIALLHQVTGLSDVVRGQQDRNETATTSRIKAGFASTRIQTMQDEVARFASELQALRAEIVARHFQPETIMERSNIQRTKDADFAQQAVELIRSDIYGFRVCIRPESISLPDMAQQKQQRSEVLAAMAQTIQADLPMIQAMMAVSPDAALATINLTMDKLQYLVAGMRGSSAIESALDRYRAMLTKIAQQKAAEPPQPPPPDPRLEAEKVKAGAEQFKAQADMAKTRMGIQVAQQKHAMDMQKMQADTMKKQVDAQTDVAKAQALSQQPASAVLARLDGRAQS